METGHSNKTVTVIALIAAAAAVILTIILSAGGGRGADINNTDTYLRLHIRADSNAAADQNIKYRVKDELSPVFAELVKDCKTKSDTESVLKKNLTKISTAAAKILADNGFTYGADAKLASEYFPARAYDDDTVLDSGVYDALVLNLGSGAGDNWWCVIYPPLCFGGSDNGTKNIKYKSYLWDLFFE